MHSSSLVTSFDNNASSKNKEIPLDENKEACIHSMPSVTYLENNTFSYGKQCP